MLCVHATCTDVNLGLPFTSNGVCLCPVCVTNLQRCSEFHAQDSLPGVWLQQYTLAINGWYGDSDEGIEAVSKRAHADFWTWALEMKAKSFRRILWCGLATCLIKVSLPI